MRGTTNRRREVGDYRQEELINGEIGKMIILDVGNGEGELRRRGGNKT